MSEGWTTNTDVAALARWLGGKHSVVVLTHVKPDGDAVGSSVAVARALNIAAGGSAAGFSGVASRAEVWYAGPAPGWLGAIVGNTKHRLIREDDDLPAATPDAVVITDTGSWSQLEPFAGWLRGKADRTAVLDHHLRGDGDVGAKRVIETRCAAACEVVAPLCVRLLGLAGASGLPLEVAEPLYLGLATDTGWFRHSNVTPAAMRLAADLIEAGVNHERLHETVELRERPSRLTLLARALASIEYLNDGELAIMTLKAADFAAAGAAPGESGGFLDLVRTVESVRVAALLTETGGEGGAGRVITKISLRSKGGAGMVDVNEVAGRLGGGGHAQAAGARLEMPLTQARERLLGALS